MKKKITLNIPLQMQYLCSLWEITPQQLLQAFIDDACQCPNNSGSDESIKAASYLLRCGYGMYFFDYTQTVQMIVDLEDIRSDWYRFDNDHKKEYRAHARKKLRAWYTRWSKIKRERLAKEKDR